MTTPARKNTTTRRPASKTSPAEASVAEIDLADIDFDSWSAEQEEAAIEQLREDLKPKFILVEKSLAAKFPSGFILKTSLDVPYEKLNDIVKSGDTGDQMEAVLGFLGQAEEIPVLKRQGIIAVIAFAERYFEMWQKVAGTSLGESNGSTGS